MNFLNLTGLELERIFITKIGIVNRKVTSQVYPAGFFDTEW